MAEVMKATYKVEKKYNNKTLGNWITGVSRPEIDDFMILADVLRVTPEWLWGLPSRSPSRMQEDFRANLSPEKTAVPSIEGEKPAAALQISGAAYTQLRAKIIRETQGELWIVNRVGSSFTTANDAYTALDYVVQNRKIRLHIMLPDPDKTATVTNVALARKYAPGDDDATAKHIDLAKRTFEILIERSSDPSLAEIRFIPYAPVWVIYTADPTSESGKALVATIPFRGEALAVPHMLIEKSKEPELFDWFYQDVLAMWTTFQDSTS